jgi:hypothetical protein
LEVAVHLDCGDVALGLFAAYGVIGLLLAYIEGRHGKDGEPPAGIAAWMPSSYTARGKVWWCILLAWMLLFPVFLEIGYWAWMRYCP